MTNIGGIMNFLRFVLVASTVALAFSTAAQSTRPNDRPTVTVSRDGRSLEIQRPSDHAPVRVPVLDHCGNPMIGEPKITQTRLAKASVFVRYGKHCWAKVSLKTLAVDCRGCD
jgi:hypothetical protein